MPELSDIEYCTSPAAECLAADAMNLVQSRQRRLLLLQPTVPQSQVHWHCRRIPNPQLLSIGRLGTIN